MRNKTSFVRYSPKFITRKWYCRKAKSQNETSKWKHNPTDKEIKSIFFTRFILFYFFLFIFLLLSFIKARKIEWKDGICIRVYSLLFEPFKAFSLHPSRSQSASASSPHLPCRRRWLWWWLLLHKRFSWNAFFPSSILLLSANLFQFSSFILEFHMLLTVC